MTENSFPGVEFRDGDTHYAVLDAGAHVLNWTPPGQRPVLWVSPLTSLEPGVAVRGGVPIVFPWFGTGADGDRQPLHGFARITPWTRRMVDDQTATGGGLTVGYELDNSGLDQQRFAAAFRVSFSADELSLALTVTNTGTEAFNFEEALHTYFAVSDIAAITVTGLEGCTFSDRSAGADPAPQQQEGPISFTGETDRLYVHSGTAVIDDPAWGRRIEVSKDASAQSVVWNPGVTKGTSMADVGEFWPGLVCVEAANVREHGIELAPGASHVLRQHIRLR